jgi:hypothetical protein
MPVNLRVEKPRRFTYFLEGIEDICLASDRQHGRRCLLTWHANHASLLI